jgi:hypothetical protein
MTATNPASGQKGYITGTNIMVFADGQAVTNDQGGGKDFIPLAPASPPSKS